MCGMDVPMSSSVSVSSFIKYGSWVGPKWERKGKKKNHSPAVWKAKERQNLVVQSLSIRSKRQKEVPSSFNKQ